MIGNYNLILVEALVMPLGVYSDSVPWTSDSSHTAFRVSANEMRKRINVDEGIPVTLSPCRKIHSMNVIGFVQRFRIADNGLHMFASIWSGLLPPMFDISKMGCSIELRHGIEHCGWMRDFEINAVALVLRDKAAFTSTYVDYVREIKCTEKTYQGPVKSTTRISASR